MPPSDELIDLGDRRLRVRRLAPRQEDGLERTTLIFLHEGLGCVEMWRDFPQRLCDATRCPGIVYDRTGYGGSSPWPANPGVRYMELEADEILPRLLAKLGVEDCVLVGHSDGGTIALNYAASDPGPLRAVVTLAAHAVNEPVCVEAIRRARTAFASGDLRARLRKYHGDNVDGAFHLWSDAWVAPGFEPMDADRRLPESSCRCRRSRARTTIMAASCSSASSPARSAAIARRAWCPTAATAPTCNSLSMCCRRSPASWRRWRW